MFDYRINQIFFQNIKNTVKYNEKIIEILKLKLQIYYKKLDIISIHDVIFLFVSLLYRIGFSLFL